MTAAMSEYTTYDFSESLDGAGVPIGTVRRVVAAWGESPEGFASWTGGFLLELCAGGYAYVTGWCDTTGWGCQDGTELHLFDVLPERCALPGTNASTQWDEDPEDLNLIVRGETAKPDSSV